MECQFCKKVLKSNASLVTHQATTKTCLKIQGKLDEFVSFKCEFCNKIFTTKQYLVNHVNFCKYKELHTKIKEIDKKCENKLKDKDKKCEMKLKNKDKECENKLKNKDKEIIQLKNQISELKGQLITFKEDHELIKDIAKQVKNTNNITNNNLTISSFIDFNDINKAKMLIDNKLDINHIVCGQKGLAHFVKDTLLTDDTGKLTYMCSDPSRNIFKYKDCNGDIKKDVEAKKLTNYILEGGIKTKSALIGNEWCKDEKGDIDMDKFAIMMEQQNSIMKLSDDNNIFKKELVSITTF
jgi:hypothetical protein